MIRRVIVDALIIRVLSNSFMSIGVSSYYQLLIESLLLMVAVAFGSVQRNHTSKAFNKTVKQIAKGGLLWHFSQEISGQKNW